MATNLDLNGGERQVDFTASNSPFVGQADGQANHDPNSLSGNFAFANSEGVALTTLSTGNFGAIYSSEYNGNFADYDLVYQAFHPDGTPSGLPFQVVSSGGLQVNPEIAAYGSGGAVIVWSDNAVAEGFDILLETVSDAGVASPPLTIFDFGPAVGDNPAIAGFANGFYLVAAERFSSGGDHDVVVRAINSGLNVLFPTVTLENSDTNWQGHPRVATSGNTGVVVYEDGTPSANARTGITLDVFNIGTDVVANHAIANSATDNLANPDVAALADGHSYVVTWTNESTNDIFGEIYDSSTNTNSAPFAITTLAGSQDFSRVAALPDGGFTVTWNDFSGTLGDLGAGGAVHERRFDATGTAIGDEFLVNTATQGFQGQADVAANGTGAVFTAWTDNNTTNANSTDISGNRLEGQALTVSPLPTITSNGGGAAAAVSIAENTTAVTTVTATETGVGQTLSYSIIGGADASKFAIGASTGALSFVTAPNFEAPTDTGGNNVYDVTVKASDGHGGIDTQAIAVTVTDVNEAPIHEISRVERFFDTATNDHFYTASVAEANQIRATLPTFHDEGAPWGTPDKGTNTVDVFRFFDAATGDHFYTNSVAERDNIIAHNPTYHLEGIAFEAFTAPGDGTLTLERFFNTALGVHHYSASAAETAAINAGAVGPGWVEEGPGFIVHT
jgi:Repeat of unknown function (DUF5648)